MVLSVCRAVTYQPTSSSCVSGGQRGHADFAEQERKASSHHSGRKQTKVSPITLQTLPRVQYATVQCIPSAVPTVRPLAAMQSCVIWAQVYAVGVAPLVHLLAKG